MCILTLARTHPNKGGANAEVSAVLVEPRDTIFPRYTRGLLFLCRCGCLRAFDIRVLFALNIIYPVPCHASDDQSQCGEQVERKVVIEGEWVVAVDREGEQHRADHGGYCPSERASSRRDAV